MEEQKCIWTNNILLSCVGYFKWNETSNPDDTPEFYAELMKRCWDHDPENRPTAKEIGDCLVGYFYSAEEEKKEIIKLAEAKI